MTESEHILSVIAEECNEVAQRVSKALRFGLEEIQPGQPLTNAERIVEELDDLKTVVQMAFARGLIGRLPEVKHSKRVKVLAFINYARKVGALILDPNMCVECHAQLLRSDTVPLCETCASLYDGEKRWNER